MDNFKNWLQTSQAPKAAIVVVNHIYLDSPANTCLSTHAITLDNTISCLPIIKDDITVSESISLDYSSSISYGDISIANNTGTYDAWLTSSYVWANQSISVYIGEVPANGEAALTDFELVFSGTVVDIDSKDSKTISFKIRDNSQQLNTSLSEELLGDYNPNSLVGYTNTYQNNLKPICFGEVHNITPMLTSPGLLEYMVHVGEVEQILEVRDSGVPVAFTPVGVPAGSFRLVRAPAGAITCSVQGAKTTVNLSSSSLAAEYTNTAANTIATILTQYGKPVEYTQLDSSSFSALAQQPIGVHYSSRMNVLSACQELAKSCGTVLAASRLGKFRLIDVGVATIPALSVYNYEAAPYGVALSTDGTKLYVVGASSDRVRQFALGNPWDITTATYTTSVLVGTQDTTSTEVQFNSTGTRMFVIGSSTDAIYTYQLATPWQVDTATLVLPAFSVATYEATPNALAFSRDGYYVYVLGTTSDTIRQFSLTTAYDLNTATYAGYFLVVSSTEGSPTGLTFSPDGLLMFVVGAAGDQVITYTLTTPWLVTSAILADRLSLANIDTAPHSIAFSADGFTMYISGDTSNSIYQFKLSEAWNPSSMDPPIIDEGDITYNSLQVRERTSVVAGYKIGYAKNWTVQTNLLTAIPPEHKELYSTEYLETSIVDTAASTSYAVTTEPALEPTYLIRGTDAQALGAKKLTMSKTPRLVYSMRCAAKWLYLEAGGAVQLKFTRFGLTNGRLGQVISAKPNWLRNYIDIEVLV